MRAKSKGGVEVFGEGAAGMMEIQSAQRKAKKCRAAGSAGKARLPCWIISMVVPLNKALNHYLLLWRCALSSSSRL